MIQYQVAKKEVSILASLDNYRNSYWDAFVELRVTLFCILALKCVQSTAKVFLNDFSLKTENCNQNPYFIRLKEHLFSYDKGYHGTSNLDLNRWDSFVLL